MAAKKTSSSASGAALTSSKVPKDFKAHLAEIAAILEWFDSQEELDVELALEKVKSASELIAASKKRLGEIENEFKEIKKIAESE